MNPELEQARLNKLLDTITLQQAEAYLAEVHPDHHFHVYGGGAITGLHHLKDTLAEMSDEQFLFHVNTEKNDFKNWIKDVIEDKRLARDVILVRKKETMINKIEQRIDNLKFVIDKKR